jgi:rhodanese-related sulfurtransferase
MTMHELAAFLESHYLLSSALLIVIVLLLIIETLRAKSNIYKLSPLQVTQSINREKATVIDIRPADVYHKGHIIGALSIPQANLASQIKKIEKLKAKPIIIVCDSGSESQKSAVSLRNSGYNAYYLASGMRAWLDAQMPLIKG